MKTGRRLLVIEDDDGIQELLSTVLSGDELTFATNQDDANRALASHEFDLVLLDLKLPRREGALTSDRQVGIDILRQIRERGLRQRGTEMLLPVVVMTAHGSEALSADLLVRTGANDYLPKPFGTAGELEHKIDIALSGEGTLVAANIGGRTIRVAFCEDDSIVEVETIVYRGANYDLLRVLGDLFIADVRGLLSIESFRRVPGSQLAHDLGIAEASIRKRINRFRDSLSRDSREQLGRTIRAEDIIESGQWRGYRLNPRVVRIVKWAQRPRPHQSDE